jgi:hypothetical protein
MAFIFHYKPLLIFRIDIGSTLLRWGEGRKDRARGKLPE